MLATSILQHVSALQHHITNVECPHPEKFVVRLEYVDLVLFLHANDKKEHHKNNGERNHDNLHSNVLASDYFFL